MHRIISLSVIIPCYNEEYRISQTIKELLAYLKSLDITYEIIIVNDGSLDQTYKKIQEIALHSPDIKIISYTKNQGKGYAVKAGIQKSIGEYYLLMDADLATDLSELEKFWKSRHLADCIIGNRTFNYISPFRKIAGWIAHKIIMFFFHLDVQDTQCGFKLLSHTTKSIWHSVYANRWGYDFELLYLLQKGKYTIKELPVKWIAMPGSKVTLFSYFTTLIELYKILRKHRIKI